MEKGCSNRLLRSPLNALFYRTAPVISQGFVESTWGSFDLVLLTGQVTERLFFMYACSRENAHRHYL